LRIRPINAANFSSCDSGKRDVVVWYVRIRCHIVVVASIRNWKTGALLTTGFSALWIFGFRKSATDVRSRQSFRAAYLVPYYGSAYAVDYDTTR